MIKNIVTAQGLPCSGVRACSPCMQAVDNLMPGFDKEIARLAQRLLINPRRIDYHTGVLATKVHPRCVQHRHRSSVSSLLVTACCLLSTRHTGKIWQDLLSKSAVMLAAL